MKILFILLLGGLVAACANTNSNTDNTDNADAATAEMSEKDKALSCLLRWDMSFYAYTMRSAGGTQSQAIEELNNWYGESHFIAKEIRPATNIVYGLKDIKTDPVHALGDSLKPGFQECLTEKSMADSSPYLARCLDMGIYITYVASAKSRQLSKQQVIDQLSPLTDHQHSIITQVYSSPQYEAGVERMKLWGQCIQRFEG
ncbi:hypothetical protein [Marinobacter confluentis]|uniref:Uncharacterized protein n=1 Tax=Marinobacter confluentis TaxID=1697557 RepID=A0A4Z1BG12_9GAMM|nr:hypothetical protein [Marinobacter confluentis]TGN41694.1 hypothetical protein E5Q11_03980 [Marinobacter confluentis]